MITSSMRLRNSGRKWLSRSFFTSRSMAPWSRLRSLIDLAAEVRGHDDDRVLEIDRPAFAVREAAVVQDLEEDVEDVGMGLFDLVQEDDGIRAAFDRLGELSSLLVAHVAGRRADEAGHGVLLHVFGHVQPDHGFFRIEQELGQGPGQLGLADARRPEENERAERPGGVLNARPAPAGSCPRRPAAPGPGR